MDSREARLIRCFQIVFPHLQDKEIITASASSVKAWDSLATVTLIGVIEEEFGIQLDLDNVEEMVSFEGFLKHLQIPAL